MFKKRNLLIGGAVAALLGCVLAASVALADTPTPTPKPGAQGMLQNYISRLAANLGISQDALTKAMVQTSDDLIDQAVKDGKLNADQAAKLKERVANGNPLLGLPQRPPRPFGPAAGPLQRLRIGMLQAAVKALSELTNETVDQVKAEVKAAGGPQKYLTSKGITLQQLGTQIATDIKPRLDQAVANGKLTADQETNILNRIKQGQLNLGIPAYQGFLRNAAVKALSELTNESVDQVKADVKAAGGLQKFLTSKGITQQQLRDQIATDIKPQLDQQVASGKMTAEQETQILNRIKQGPPKNGAQPGLPNR